MGEKTFKCVFDKFLERKEEEKTSCIFAVWYQPCYFYLTTRDRKCSECPLYWSFYLKGFQNRTCNFERTFKLCLIGPSGNEILANNRTRIKMFDERKILLMTIREKELREDADLLPGGTLILQLSWYEERDEKRPMKMLETLSRDLSRFHASNTSTDCVLRVGKIELPAHRNVLCARSEVFAAMFRHETAENRNGVVDILDVKADVMRDCLNYMYAGTVQRLTTSNAAPLFIAAKKYRLTLLQEACLSFLTDNLTVGNVCDAAVLADTYGEEELEKKVVQFIGDRMADIQGSAEWKKFLHNEQPLSMKLLFSLTALKDVKK